MILYPFISPIVMYTYFIHTYKVLTVHAYNSFTHSNINSNREIQAHVLSLSLFLSKCLSQVPLASRSGTCWFPCLANQGNAWRTLANHGNASPVGLHACPRMFRLILDPSASLIALITCCFIGL